MTRTNQKKKTLNCSVNKGAAIQFQMLTRHSGVVEGVAGCEVDGAAPERPSVGSVGSSAWCHSRSSCVPSIILRNSAKSTVVISLDACKTDQDTDAINLNNQTVTKHNQRSSQRAQTCSMQVISSIYYDL